MMDNRLTDKQASDFELMDTKGSPVRLSNFKGSKNIVLVFNRSLY